jgi:hypothetical protein
MNLQKCVTIGLVLGVVANVLDFIVQGYMLAGMYASIPIFAPNPPIAWLVVGDFVAAFVFAWVYLRFAAGVQPGPAGGATFGFYAGVLVGFPQFIFLYLTITGFPYYVAWIWIVWTIVLYVALGAVAGVMNKR